MPFDIRSTGNRRLLHVLYDRGREDEEFVHFVYAQFKMNYYYFYFYYVGLILTLIN